MSTLKKPNTSLRTSKGVLHKTALALTIPGLLASHGVMANDDEAIVLDTLQIEERTVDTNPYAEKGAPYKARISGDKRHVKELADTPQTISVLTQTQIQESGDSDLKDILASQPGITLGTGENGNAFGDRYIIRGHEARSDVFVDGLRDPGMTIRESFAVEQVEITKGPSSTFAGRGSTGGAVNSITKQASTEYDFSKVQAGFGSDDYQRYTLDANQRLSDDLALRINLMGADEDVPDRDPANRERDGVALSAAYQATDKLNLIADAYYMRGEDKPDLGTYIDRDSGSPNSHIPVYLQSEDFIKSTVRAFTFRLGYDFRDNWRLENATRYGTTDNGYVVTGARGTQRDATDPDAPGADTISLSTHQGWQEVEYFVNQSNLYWDTELSGMRHQFIFGIEYSELNVINGTYDVDNAGTTNCVTPGRGGARPGYCLVDAGGNYVDAYHLMGRDISKSGLDSDYDVDTISWSIMDTIDINDSWTLFLGLRYDDFDYENFVVGRSGSNQYKYDDELWNGHVGVVYHINEDANVYLTYSTSSNINGGESDVGGNCGYGGLCGSDIDQISSSDPEDTENIELGTKWNIMDNKLLLTAALFQITKDDVMENVGDDYDSLGGLNTGKNRVQGVEFSAVGNITERVSTAFGATFMDSEIRESFDKDSEGGMLANFAEKSAYLQLRYQATPKFSFGGSATYSGEMFAGQPDTAAGDVRVPSYTVYDLFGSYEVDRQLSFRLNVGNLTDKDYYLAAYRSGSFAYIGDRRNVQLTMTYEF